MNEMIWNTLGIWLISLGILLSLTLFSGIFGGGFGATLFFIFSGLFIVPITSMIAGFRAANGKGNIVIILIITIIIGIILLYFVSDGFYLYTKESWISLNPLLITLLGFGLGKLMLLIKNINPIWHGVSIFLTIFTFAILIYLLSAFGSIGAYSPIPNEWFYVRPPNSPNALFVQMDSTNTHFVFSNEINEPFTGKVTSFKKRLTLDFFTKKAGGISYYIDGFNFGVSGEAIQPNQYNGPLGPTRVADKWNYKKQQINNQMYLLHKDYQKIISQEFPAREAIYYMESENAKPSSSITSLPKTTVVYVQENTLIRKEVTYHKNGVVNCIEIQSNSGDGWKQINSFNFDELGYRSREYLNFDKQLPWHENDFILSDFNAYEYIRQTYDKSLVILDRPTKMLYVPYPENWQEGGNLLDNIILVYGFPLTSIFSIYIGGPYQSLLMLEVVEEISNICDLIGRSTLNLNFTETGDEVAYFQYRAIRFNIYSETNGESLMLYYKDGKILIENGPYYLDLLAESKDDSKEDVILRKKLYQNLMNIIGKYIKE